MLSLAAHLRSGLASILGVTMNDTAAQTCGIVTFSVSGVSPAAVVDAAAQRRVMINASTATWAALGMHAKGLTQVVRASPQYFNTEAELDRLLEVVQDVV